VGATKRGKGTKLMAVADRFGLPLAVCAASASPHEVTLVAATLDSGFIDELPQRLIGDRAYDADPLDKALAELGIEMIASHRRGRTRAKTQDGRPLRRCRRRWKVERLFAWLGNFRHLVVRYERHARELPRLRPPRLHPHPAPSGLYEKSCTRRLLIPDLARLRDEQTGLDCVGRRHGAARSSKAFRHTLGSLGLGHRVVDLGSKAIRA
jgi:transposase